MEQVAVLKVHRNVVPENLKVHCSPKQYGQIRISKRHSMSVIGPEISPFRRSDQNTIPPQLLKQISRAICSILTVSLPSFSKNPLPSNAVVSEDYELSEEGLDMKDKMIQFYEFIQIKTRLTPQEITLSYILLKRFLTAEAVDIQYHKAPLVALSNIGTLLISASLLTIKMFRDTPFNNHWWSQSYNVPLPVLNQSELIFLKKINCSCNVSLEEFNEVSKSFLCKSYL